jgi:hypothetical protein
MEIGLLDEMDILVLAVRVVVHGFVPELGRQVLSAMIVAANVAN